MSPINLLVLICSTFFSVLTHASYPTSSGSYCTPHVVTPWEQNQIWTKFVDEFYVKKDIPAAFTYVEPIYIQHNPFVLSGVKAAVGKLTEIIPPADITIYHLSSVDNNIGFIHFRIQGGPAYPIETAITDVYRFNGSCVVEHWDMIQPKPANATNPLAMF